MFLVYIVKQYNKILDFLNLMKIEVCRRLIFEIYIFHKPHLWSFDVPHKIWAQSVEPFRCLLNTDKQTSKVNTIELLAGQTAESNCKESPWVPRE